MLHSLGTLLKEYNNVSRDVFISNYLDIYPFDNNKLISSYLFLENKINYKGINIELSKNSNSLNVQFRSKLYDNYRENSLYNKMNFHYNIFKPYYRKILP